jgi:hypothetical protein
MAEFIIHQREKLSSELPVIGADGLKKQCHFAHGKNGFRVEGGNNDLTKIGIATAGLSASFDRTS